MYRLRPVLSSVLVYRLYAPLLFANARYVMDALSAITADPVQLEFNDELSPGILRPADDLSYTCVVMPMRI